MPQLVGKTVQLEVARCCKRRGKHFGLKPSGAEGAPAAPSALPGCTRALRAAFEEAASCLQLLTTTRAAWSCRRRAFAEFGGCQPPKSVLPPRRRGVAPLEHVGCGLPWLIASSPRASTTVRGLRSFPLVSKHGTHDAARWSIAPAGQPRRATWSHEKAPPASAAGAGPTREP